MPMNKKMLCGLGVLAGTSALIAGSAFPASADTTNVTFTLAAGGFSVSAQANAALTNGSSGSTSVSGTLGDVVVTDNRGGITGWSAKAATNVFTNDTTNATAVSYNSGLVTPTGVAVTTSSGATALSGTAAQVVSAAAVVGNNTATWNPTLTVTLPSSSTAGDYTGTITTSLL